MNSLFKISNTNRGFAVIEFKDRYDKDCSIQISSLATENCLWMGIKPDRMHVTRDMAKGFIKILTKWLETEWLELPEGEP